MVKQTQKAAKDRLQDVQESDVCSISIGPGFFSALLMLHFNFPAVDGRVGGSFTRNRMRSQWGILNYSPAMKILSA